MKTSQTKTGLTAAPTYPLKNEEGAIIEEAKEEEGEKYETYYAYSNGKVYEYYHATTGDGEAINFVSAKVTVDSSSGNYTLYQKSNADVDTSESYVWFNNEKMLIDCDLKPGKYYAKDVDGKCGIDFEVDKSDEYFFKKSADAGEAYSVYNKDQVSSDYDSDDKYTVKSLSAISDIMNSYPQSSSVIIPSIMIVLAVLFLFL